MTINIISNVKNGFGLQKDFNLLHKDLTALGHQVVGVQFDEKDVYAPADINLFLEVLVPDFFRFAPKQYFIPNPEQWKPTYWEYFSRLDKILCKTMDAYRIFSNLGSRVEYIGFRSEDILIKDLQRKYTFIHIGGKNSLKGTKAILDTWEHYQIHVPILISTTLADHKIPNVFIVDRIEDSEFAAVMNSYLFHLCPSSYEGFGHTFHEALGCGNVVIGINHPPINECALDPRLMVSKSGERKVGLASVATIDCCDVYQTVMDALSLSDNDLERIGINNRIQFETETIIFRSRLMENIWRCEMNEIPPPPTGMRLNRWETRVCPVCHKYFWIRKVLDKIHCDRKCAEQSEEWKQRCSKAGFASANSIVNKNRILSHWETRKCFLCKREFRVKKSQKKIYCSLNCANRSPIRLEKLRQCMIGDSRCSGHKHSSETRQKMRLKKLGKHISPQTEYKKGFTPWIKGKTCITNNNICSGERHPKWLGSSVSYIGLHQWIIKKLGSPLICSHCGFASNNKRQFHWSNKDHQYKRDIKDWVRLCVKCHIQYDKKIRKK